MKRKIKNIIKNNILGIYLLQIYRTFKYYSHMQNPPENKWIFLFKLFFKTRVYKNKVKGIEIIKLLKKTKIKIQNDNDFIYFLDYYKSTSDSNYKISNTSIDYSKVIDSNIEEYKKSLNENTLYGKNGLKLLEGIELYIERLKYEIQKSELKNKDTFLTYFENIKSKHCESFEEALQRILFFNQILWQTNHRLNGLGRLDKILYQTYQNDIESKIISKEKAKGLIKNFLKILHKDFWFKSNDLIGDTGQIIILGGQESNGSYFCNELTYLFIEALKELRLPDPKILLRISKKTPDELIKLSLECISTGIGCPLLANDEAIIPRLIDFGYQEKDAYNYVTSACWEPLIIGKDLGQNNITYINFLEPLEKMTENEEFNNLKNYNEFLDYYQKYLEKYLENLMKELDEIKWEKDPLISLFTENCSKIQKDIADGGALYNNYGVTGVAISNTVNAILTVKKLVFEEKIITLEALNSLKNINFEENSIVSDLEKEFGNDEHAIIDLTNQIVNFASKAIENYRNQFGGKLKFGFSAPSYIIASKGFPASFDGRKSNQPFGVHISSRKGIPYTELLQFAGKLDYSENRINGNVVDFILSPNFLTDNIEKFISFIKASIVVGFYELQINVVSSTKLIEARNNPEKFPDLIVRVWGFSTYFKDLPDEYKDYIIERTKKSESINY